MSARGQLDIGVFERMQWGAESVTIGDLVLKRSIQGTEPSYHELVLFKDQSFVEQYRRFWSGHQDFTARTIVELGIFGGGSLALWHKLFQPEKLIGFDIRSVPQGTQFRDFLASPGVSPHIECWWETDQQNGSALLQRLPPNTLLDLVVDDASHYYEYTRASFETLFPRLRAGGLYIIEDWAWGHWPTFNHAAFDGRTPLSKLIFQLTEIAGMSPRYIQRIEVFQGFVAVERGPHPLPAPFTLEGTIINDITN